MVMCETLSILRLTRPHGVGPQPNWYERLASGDKRSVAGEVWAVARLCHNGAPMVNVVSSSWTRMSAKGIVLSAIPNVGGATVHFENTSGLK